MTSIIGLTIIVKIPNHKRKEKLEGVRDVEVTDPQLNYEYVL